MKQFNTDTGKTREIRPPYKMKPPGKPIVPPGPTMVVTVPPGGAGQTIQVPHPKDKSQFIAVQVPPGARPGQTMLVPVPPLGSGGGGGGGGGGAPPAPVGGSAPTAAEQ